MATTKEFRDYVVEAMTAALGEVFCRPMMGEYLLYHGGALFGGIYDGRVLIKICESNKKFGLSEEIPYKGAKPMFMIEELDNSSLVREIVLDTIKGLKNKS